MKENTIQMMSKTLTHIGKRRNSLRTNERNWNKYLANVRFELLNCGLFNEEVPPSGLSSESFSTTVSLPSLATESSSSSSGMGAAVSPSTSSSESSSTASSSAVRPPTAKTDEVSPLGEI